jgi:hypothetical protein
LRLEFDAHRLRCRRCQQTLAMLEAAGHVIASDTHTPAVSDDFTARVMSAVAQPRARVIRFPRLRVAIVAAALVQAAAILTIAIIRNGQTAEPAQPTAPTVRVAGVESTLPDPGAEGVRSLFVEGVEDRLWEMFAAGRNLPSDVLGLARYLDITLPADVARESSKLANVNPWQAFWGPLGAGDEEEPEAAPPAGEIHSI